MFFMLYNQIIESEVKEDEDDWYNSNIKSGILNKIYIFFFNVKYYITDSGCNELQKCTAILSLC